MGEAPDPKSDLTCHLFDGKGPEWRRLVAVANDGEVFVPAAVAGNEERVFLLASYDGDGAAFFDDHVYLPLSWLVREFPDVQEISDVLMRNLTRKGWLGPKVDTPA